MARSILEYRGTVAYVPEESLRIWLGVILQVIEQDYGVSPKVHWLRVASYQWARDIRNPFSCYAWLDVLINTSRRRDRLISICEHGLTWLTGKGTSFTTAELERIAPTEGCTYFEEIAVSYVRPTGEKMIKLLKGEPDPSFESVPFDDE